MSLAGSTKGLGPSIAVIGAGAGGLAFAIALKRQLGYDNFVIFEKASDVGGTWRDNIYPGCSSDIPMAFYSLSTDLHDWPQSHGSQSDILAYWQILTQKYKLYPHIQFNHKVVSASWNASTSVYDIVTLNTVTGKRKTATANILVSAIGILEVPRFADIPGVESFKGEAFHSARWDNSVDLQGKRVAVIGNGASATQFVPIITEDPSVQVMEFCRTPNWLMPPVRTSYSPFRRWLFRTVPGATRLLRWLLFLRLELLYVSVFGNGTLRQMLTKVAKAYIVKNAPKEYLKNLVPTYPLGCKRIIFDTNFLSALHRPNLDLNWDGIESITEEGIVTKKTGETIPFDVLIFATGYAADFYPIPVYGRNRQSVQDYYEAAKGAKAYLGTTIPGFPNFFTVFGPNTATGHTSVIFTNEVQVNYIIQLIKPLLQRKAMSLEVKAKPTDDYNNKIHSRLSTSVFTQCLSWYRVGGEGKVTNIFPGAATVFWLWLRKPNFDHYIAVGAKTRLRNESLFRTFVKGLLVVALLAVAVAKFHQRSPQTLAPVVGWVVKQSTSASIKLVPAFDHPKVEAICSIVDSQWKRLYFGS